MNCVRIIHLLFDLTTPQVLNIVSVKKSLRRKRNICLKGMQQCVIIASDPKSQVETRRRVFRYRIFRCDNSDLFEIFIYENVRTILSIVIYSECKNEPIICIVI